MSYSHYLTLSPIFHCYLYVLEINSGETIDCTWCSVISLNLFQVRHWAKLQPCVQSHLNVIYTVVGPC